MGQDGITRDENALREKIKNLSDNDRKLFYLKVENKIKDPDTYAVLNWLFIAGIHHFYLKRWLKGFINISVFIVGIILLFANDGISFGIGIGMLLALFIVELVQLFKSQDIVQDYNNIVTEKILEEIQVKA